MAGGATRPGSGPFWAEPSRQRNEDFSEGRQGPSGIGSLDRQGEQTGTGPAKK
jgi:hypothetical protein